MDKTRIANSLKEYFRNQGVTQQEIAESMGVSQAYIGKILNGDRAIGKQTAEKLNTLYGFSRGWLLTGEGDMLIGDTNVTNNGTSQQVAQNVRGHVTQSVTSDLTSTITELTDIIKQSQELVSTSQEIAITAQRQLNSTLSQLAESQSQITTLIDLINRQQDK